MDQYSESGKMSQAGYREQAHNSACASQQEKQECCGTGRASLYLDILYPCAVYQGGWLPVCLKSRAKSQRAFYLKPATPVTFPLPSQKGEAAIQRLARQMTVELSHPVIWESLPMFVPPWDSQRSQHAPTCPSSTLCQLPPCQWAPVKVPHLWLRDGL